MVDVQQMIAAIDIGILLFTLHLYPASAVVEFDWKKQENRSFAFSQPFDKGKSKCFLLSVLLVTS